MQYSVFHFVDSLESIGLKLKVNYVKKKKPFCIQMARFVGQVFFLSEIHVNNNKQQ